MRTVQERPAPDDVATSGSPDADAPARRSLDDAPGLVAAGAWAAIFLVLFGAPGAGLAVAAATAAGLAVWRYRGTGHPAVPDRRPGSTAG